ncbi:MAG: FAD-binding oxidoreductase [Nitratireductor sp.]
MNSPTSSAMDNGATGHVHGFYSQTAGKLPVHEPLNASLTADVCVIGGGLAGLTTALELARGGKSVILLEAERIGWGASGRNGGFVSASFARSIFAIEDKLGLDHARALYRLSTEGVGYVRNTIRSSGRDDIIQGQGWLKMIRHADLASLEMRRTACPRLWCHSDVSVEVELASHVSSDRYHAGLLDMGPFHIHPLRYCGLVGELAAQAGVRIFEHSRAVAVSGERGIWQVQTDKGMVRGSNIVIATSAYGGPVSRINQSIRRSRPMWSVRARRNSTKPSASPAV